MQGCARQIFLLGVLERHLAAHYALELRSDPRYPALLKKMNLAEAF